MEKPFILRHSKKVLALMVFLGALAAIFYYSPFWKEMTSWRASQLLGKARESAEAGNWSEAERLAMASMQIEQSLAGARLVTEANIKQDKKEALGFAYELFYFDGATATDKAVGLRLAVDNRQVKIISKMVGDLTQEEIREPKVHFQVVRALLMTRQVGSAIRLADLPEVQPRDPRIDLMIVNALAADASEGARAEARARLRDVLEHENREIALDGMMLLSSLRGDWLPESLAGMAVARFGDDPDLTLAQRLVVKALQIGSGQIEREDAIAETVREYRKEHLVELLTWLNNLGEFERVVALSDNPAVKEDEEVLRLRFPALAELERWETLKEELDTLSVPLAEPVSLALKATVAHRLERPAEFQRLWIKAMEMAKMDSGRNYFLALADAAEEIGKTQESIEAVIAAVNHNPPVLPGSEVLMKSFAWLAKRDEPERLLKFSQQLVNLVPENPVYRNNYHFLKGVHGEVTGEDLEKMEDLVESQPEVIVFRCSYAFLLLRGGEPERALAEIEKVTEAGGEPTELGKAVRAKALEVIGEAGKAKEAAEEVDYQSFDEDQLKHLQLSVSP